MSYVLIIHEVEDYERWKKGFDKAGPLRKEAGELKYQVLKYEDSGNKIVHFSKWKSVESARSFFESSEISDLRKELGVKDPEFIYLNELEAGTL